MDYITYVKPENQLKLVAAGVAQYACTLTPGSFDLFLKCNGLTVDGQTIEVGNGHATDVQEVFAACPTLAANAEAIEAELNAFAIKKGWCPDVPVEVTAAFQKAQEAAKQAASDAVAKVAEAQVVAAQLAQKVQSGGTA